MTEETKHSSFAVTLDPEFKEDGKWDGSVVAGIEESVESDLTDDEVMQIRTVAGLLASCLQIMEEDEEFLDYVKEYFFTRNKALVDELESLAEESDSAPNFTKDGNVISLDFSTKTHGSA